MSEDKTITITMTCSERWIPYVLSMLKHMEYLGNIGSSRWVAIVSDGDGDFRPKFSFSTDYETKEPRSNDNGHVVFDAG